MSRFPIFFLFLYLSLPAAAGRALAAPPALLVFGDSLSAGHGIAREHSWPSLLQERLRAEKFPHVVINASIGGETTAGGKSRLPAALERHRPRIVVLALGANDGLRGLPLAPTRDNLFAMTRVAKAAGARVLIVGMRLPPNYGPDYARDFNALFATMARQENTALLPFLLEPIALDDVAFQADRLHPTAAAQPAILDHVWKTLKPLLKQR